MLSAPPATGQEPTSPRVSAGPPSPEVRSPPHLSLPLGLGGPLWPHRGWGWAPLAVQGGGTHPPSLRARTEHPEHGGRARGTWVRGLVCHQGNGLFHPTPMHTRGCEHRHTCARRSVYAHVCARMPTGARARALAHAHVLPSAREPGPQSLARSEPRFCPGAPASPFTSCAVAHRGFS